jgi:parvulin-like peptidyl-prolyl isomerase
MRWSWLFIGWIGVLAACQSGPRAGSAPSPAPAKALASPAHSGGVGGGGQVVALVDGSIVTWDMLKPGMIDAAGGQALAEWILDRRLESALAAKGLAVAQADLARERALLASQLSTDADTTQRLLEQLMESRGLGPRGLEQLIRRTAGMRKLAAADLVVSDAMVRQLYQERYGPTVEVRMILCPSVGDASRVLARLGAGESFIDLAIAHSTDESRNQGGLLPPISPLDATFPKALRDAAGKLDRGALSPIIALENGYAILKCERLIPGSSVPFETVAEPLAREARLRIERTLMARQARSLMEGVEVTVLDAELNEAWKRQRRRIDRENLDPAGGSSRPR